jgi:hypothetical protein
MRTLAILAALAIATAAAGASSGCASDDDPTIDLDQLGAACSPSHTCSPGVTCLTYTGLGGTELESCEIQCETDAGVCPPGTACITISDGPGAVCRVE